MVVRLPGVRFTTVVAMTDDLFPWRDRTRRARDPRDLGARDGRAGGGEVRPQRHRDGARAAGRDALLARLASRSRPTRSWSDRDRFILSCGHASILQYGLAHAFGYDLTPDDLRAFRQAHSRTPGTPRERASTATVEVTTGPLGQGIANGVGMAIAERILRSDYGEDLVNHRTWVIAGDGCLEEGISHEAASLAGSLGLDRLTVFYDDNHITIDGATELALHDDAAAAFRRLRLARHQRGRTGQRPRRPRGARRARRSPRRARPTLIIVRSHIGFPSPDDDGPREAHGSPFSRAGDHRGQGDPGRARRALRPRSRAARVNCVESLRRRSERPRRVGGARAAPPAQRGAALLEQLATQRGRERDDDVPSPSSAGTKVATRKAMQRAMDVFAPQTPGLTAGSADLTDNTGVILIDSSAQSARESRVADRSTTAFASSRWARSRRSSPARRASSRRLDLLRLQ